MKKRLIASLTYTIFLTLTALAVSRYGGEFIAPADTTLGDLAVSMTPGTWVAVPQTNIDAVLGHGAHAGNILHKAMRGAWDSTASRLYFLGGDGGEPASWHVYYDEAANSWVDLGLSRIAMPHGYDHLTIDPANRQLYFNPHGTDPQGASIYRYPVASNGPWNLLNQYRPSAHLPGTHGVDWFEGPFDGASSGVLSIYNCGTPGGEIAIYDPNENRQVADITGFGGNSTDHCYLAYSKVHNVAILGGGNDNGSKVWRLNPDRTVTTMPDAPVEIGIQRANVISDPATGNFLIMGYGQLWELDPRGAGTWSRQTGSREPPAGVGNPGYPDLDGVISAAISNYGVVAYTTCRARTCNMYLYKHTAEPAAASAAVSTDKASPATITITAPASDVTMAADPAPLYGLEWPGDGSVRRMLYWHNPFPIYNATYVFKVYPRKKTTGTYKYYTTFFWGNDGEFIWDGGNGNTYYGAHPYPIPAPGGPGQWEISVSSNDYVTGSEVQWNRWYTQAFRVWRESSSITHHEFYWDWPDTSKVLSHTVVDPGWADQNPPTPAIVIGQAPNFNGASWGGYPGWEEFHGIIRGIQIYSGLLSMSDLQSEIASPKSTSAGQNLIWYLNLDPRPSDVTDKKATGIAHNPSWSGTTALQWTDQAPSDTTPPSTPTNLAANVVSAGRIDLSWTASTDNVGVTGYRVERCQGASCSSFAEISTPAGTTYSDTTVSSSTTYRYKVRATDAAGNFSAYSSIATATTPASSDTTPPTVSMTAPANGATVSATTTVSASASDNVGVAGVQFKLDGVSLGAEDTTFPYSISWNTTTASNGSHTLTAVARDAAGNTTTSTAITVTVSNTILSGLIGFWKFDEGSGAAASDSSGGNHPGTFSNSPAWTTGRVGSGLQFNATDNGNDNDDPRLVIGPNLDIALPFTLAAWVNPVDFADYRAIFSKRDSYSSTNMRVDLGLNISSGTVFLGRSGSQVNFSYSPPVNAWTHLTVVATSTDTRLYVNGTLQQTSAAVSLGTDATANTVIGGTGEAIGGDNDPFKGKIDEVRVYNQALAAADVANVYSYPGSDTTPPSVSITAPAGGSTVLGTAVAVSATASDNVGAAGVQFKLDGANLGAEDTTSPYSITWNTTTASNGSHTLTAVARDAAGNSTTSSPVTVTVNNTSSDTIPPTVSVTNPANGSTVSATITVKATASDNLGVAGVQFKLDGANLGTEDTTSPYSISWNTVPVSEGSHTLTAVARDAAGNSTASSAVTVNVVNDKWTGSGKISVSGGTANFAFNARRGPTGSILGTLTFYNNVNGFSFASSSLLTLVVTGNQAVFTGAGQESVGGGPTSGPYNFTVRVKDAGTSGDTFKIEISDPAGTVAGSTTTPIVSGNIRQYY